MLWFNVFLIPSVVVARPATYTTEEGELQVNRSKIALAGIVAIATAHAIVPRSAEAEGALAFGVTDNLRDGSAYGYVTDHKTRSSAETEAMKQCRMVEEAISKVKANCRVVATFKRECVAVAMTNKAPGIGWAVAPTKEGAERQSLENCRNAAGKGRGHLCNISTPTECDTGEKID